MSVSTMPTRRSARLAALALSAALALTACSGDNDTSGDAPGTGPATRQQSEPVETEESATGATGEPTSQDPGEAKSAAEAGIDPVDLGEPFATVEAGASATSDPDASLTVDVYPLTRDMDLVTLVMRVRLNAKPESGQNLGALFGRGSRLRPVLIDTTNLRRHDVLQADGDRLSTDSLTNMDGGQTRYFSAVYAAPPADVTSMTVLFDGLPAFAGVPIR